MIAKTYLVVVALLYLGLSLWCSFSPAVTSEKVGFELKGGSGQSEFLTVYGGLEFGLALVLLYGVFKNEAIVFSLIACILIHASLVMFRSIGFFCFTGIEPMTYKLAIGEWVIFLLGLVVLYSHKDAP
jgi:hypothetical protein